MSKIKDETIAIGVIVFLLIVGTLFSRFWDEILAFIKWGTLVSGSGLIIFFARKLYKKHLSDTKNKELHKIKTLTQRIGANSTNLIQSKDQELIEKILVDNICNRFYSDTSEPLDRENLTTTVAELEVKYKSTELILLDSDFDALKSMINDLFEGFDAISAKAKDFVHNNIGKIRYSSINLFSQKIDQEIKSFSVIREEILDLLRTVDSNVNELILQDDKSMVNVEFGSSDSAHQNIIMENFRESINRTQSNIKDLLTAVKEVYKDLN